MSISNEDAREAIRGVAAFFDLLAEWDGASQDHEREETGDEQ